MRLELILIPPWVLRKPFLLLCWRAFMRKRIHSLRVRLVPSPKRCSELPRAIYIEIDAHLLMNNVYGQLRATFYLCWYRGKPNVYLKRKPITGVRWTFAPSRVLVRACVCARGNRQTPEREKENGQKGRRKKKQKRLTDEWEDVIALTTPSFFFFWMLSLAHLLMIQQRDVTRRF